MKWFILISFIYSFEVFGAYAVKESNGDIILKGGNCAELQKEAQAVFDWAFKLKYVNQGVSLTCNYTHFLGIKWGFEINITKIVPEIAKKYLSLNPNNDGPNCWNSTLVVNQISPYLRYTTPGEFSYWLNSPLCHKKKGNEPIKSGDLIAIRERFPNGGYNEVHGFTYISPNLAFTKNGYSKGSEYRLMPTDGVFGGYGVEEGCRLPPHSKKDCKYFGAVFSCQSFDQYFSTKINSEIAETFNETLLTECKLQELSLFGSKQKNKSLYNFIDMNLDILDWAVDEYKAKKNLSAEEKFIVDSMQFKITAMKEQLRLMN